MLIFFGESAHCIRNWFEVSKLLYAYTCPFPKNIKHPKIFYVCSNSKIRKFEDGFSKFWKFEKRSSKFWNIRKIGRGQMNGAIKCNFHNYWVIFFSCYSSHLNKTTTYEDPRKWASFDPTEEEEVPEPRQVELNRDPELGFGFVAGSEKPVIVR